MLPEGAAVPHHRRARPLWMLNGQLRIAQCGQGQGIRVSVTNVVQCAKNETTLKKHHDDLECNWHLASDMDTQPPEWKRVGFWVSIFARNHEGEWNYTEFGAGHNHASAKHVIICDFMPTSECLEVVPRVSITKWVYFGKNELFGQRRTRHTLNRYSTLTSWSRHIKADIPDLVWSGSCCRIGPE